MTIARNSLYDDVTRSLRAMIIDGELQPGKKIVEQTLCEKFGVSRTPLREALKVLAAEGLLNLLPRRGAVVAQITAAEIEELFPVMGALEALAGKLALGKITEGNVAKLRGLHERMVASYRRNNVRRYLELNREIHETIFEIADNGTLTLMYRQLLAKTHLARFIARKTKQQWERAIDDHNQIMDALERRDAETLAHVLYAHLVETAADIARGSLADPVG